MELSAALTIAAFDALVAHVAVVDADGSIVYTNAAWNRFGNENGAKVTEWRGWNYHAVCVAAAEGGDDFAAVVARALRDLLDGKATERVFEYPCDSPTRARRFRMRIQRLEVDGARYALIEHCDVTPPLLPQRAESAG